MTNYQNKIEKLISELCPNGVEIFGLGSICKIETGRLNANAAVVNGEYLFFTTAKEISKIDKYRWDAEALLVAGNANVGDVKHYIGKFEAYQRTYVLTNFFEKINVRFLYFVLKNNLQEFLKSNSNSAAMTYIVLSTLENFRIPVPPLAIQEEIVKILDSFTEIEVELEAELEARKKQYEYYCSGLLNSDKGVEFKELENFLDYEQPGEYIVNSTEYDSSYKTPVLTAGQGFVLGYTNEIDGIYRADKNNPVIIFDDFTTSFHWVDFDFKVKSSAIKLLRPKNRDTNFRYLYYAMKCIDYKPTEHARHWISQYSKIKIPIPSISEQERIVSILDKFDALVNDISVGLPAELKARKKQYEYYREKLLTFKELKK